MMTDFELPAFELQYRRALRFLQTEAFLSGFFALIKVTAWISGLAMALWLAGVNPLFEQSMILAYGCGAVVMLCFTVRRWPHGKNAADLIDQWIGCPDLARSYLSTKRSHPAQELLGSQLEVASSKLPTSFPPTRVRLRDLALPLAVVSAALVILQFSFKPPPLMDNRASGTEIETRIAKAATLTDQPAEPAQEKINANADEVEDSGPVSLAQVLEAQPQVPIVEIDALETTSDQTTGLSGLTEGDGAGMAKADQTGTIELYGIPDAQESILLAGTGKDGKILFADETATLSSQSIGGIALGKQSDTHLFAARLAALSPSDRALARRYMAERSSDK